MELHPGTIVAERYEVLGPLGRGGMGEVYTARNLRTERRVALKLLRADAKFRADAIERFRREARAAGMISSEFVTQVFDIEDDPDWGIVIVFELLEGESLLERLRRTGPMTPATLHPVIAQILHGLTAAHAAGVIHRDLKPSNIFLERRADGSSRVKILDFGISKLPKGMTKNTLTEPGQSLGSFMFMPPEQIHSAGRVDARADLYAVGTLAFQALTGHLPFDSTNVVELVRLKSSTNPRSLAQVLGRPTPPDLEAWIAHALARDVNARFQSANDAALAWAQLGPPGASLTPPPALAPEAAQAPAPSSRVDPGSPHSRPPPLPQRTSSPALPPQGLPAAAPWASSAEGPPSPATHLYTAPSPGQAPGHHHDGHAAPAPFGGAGAPMQGHYGPPPAHLGAAQAPGFGTTQVQGHHAPAQGAYGPPPLGSAGPPPFGASTTPLPPGVNAGVAPYFPNASPAPFNPNVTPPPFSNPNAGPPPFNPNAGPAPFNPNASPPPFSHPNASPPPFNNPNASPPPFNNPNASPPPFNPNASPAPFYANAGPAPFNPNASPPPFNPNASPPPFNPNAGPPPFNPKATPPPFSSNASPPPFFSNAPQAPYGASPSNPPPFGAGGASPSNPPPFGAGPPAFGAQPGGAVGPTPPPLPGSFSAPPAQAPSGPAPYALSPGLAPPSAPAPWAAAPYVAPYGGASIPSRRLTRSTPLWAYGLVFVLVIVAFIVLLAVVYVRFV